MGCQTSNIADLDHLNADHAYFFAKKMQKEKKYKEMTVLYEHAIEQNHKEAMYELAKYYEKKCMIRCARLYYGMAAQEGHVKAKNKYEQYKGWGDMRKTHDKNMYKQFAMSHNWKHKKEMVKKVEYRKR